MKTLLPFVLVMFFTATALAQWGAVKGEGDVVSKEIQIDNFTGIGLAFSGDIIITQGPQQKVVVEAQENLIEILNRDVKNGVWVVKFEESVKKAKPVKVYITMPSLKEAGLSGSGNLVAEGRFTGLDNLKTYVSGSGNVMLEVEANDIQSTLSGSGKIKLAGKAQNLECTISGSGDIKAFDLEVQDCKVSITGSGDTDVHVTDNLEARIVGSGDVNYRGEPNVRANVTGSGTIEPTGI